MSVGPCYWYTLTNIRYIYNFTSQTILRGAQCFSPVHLLQYIRLLFHDRLVCFCLNHVFFSIYTRTFFFFRLVFISIILYVSQATNILFEFENIFSFHSKRIETLQNRFLPLIYVSLILYFLSSLRWKHIL